MARSFYEDDELVITKPGYNNEISKELHSKETLNNVSYAKGMTIRSAPYLEEQLNKIRLYTHNKLSILEAEVNTAVSATKNEIKILSDIVDDLIKEPMLPNIIYILTATLTGSILVNRRSLPLRFLSPTIFGVLAFSYFMPASYHQVQTKLAAYESETFPEFYQQQTKFIDELKSQKKLLNFNMTNLNQDLASQIHEARYKLNDFLKESK